MTQLDTTVKSTMTETCSAVLRSRRNCSNDGAERTDDGRAFHARAAVTGKARSPSVVRRVSTWHCPHLLLSVVLWCRVDAGRPPLSINISCQHGAQQQTCHMPLLQSNDGTNRWKDTRPFHRPCSAYYVGSDNNPLLHQSVSPFAQNENIKLIRNVLQHATLKNLFKLTELRFYIPLNTN